MSGYNKILGVKSLLSNKYQMLKVS